MNQESISKKISELFDLYKSGAVSKEEFERIKKQILLEHGIEDIENEKKLGQENTTTPDKSFRVKKRDRINLSGILIIAFVIIIISLYYLFSSKSQTVNDIDGNIYHTVTIGTQVWMKENLKTTKYNDGKAIPLVADNNTWAALSTPAYCWYKNDPYYKELYSALYNCFTVNTGKLCPTGWHVPSDAEWTTMVSYLGGKSVAGGKLKEIGTTHWNSPNAGVTNETGFTALPGGHRSSNGTFESNGTSGYWWSTTEFATDRAWSWGVYYDFICIYRDDYGDNRYGFSVRCLRN